MGQGGGVGSGAFWVRGISVNRRSLAGKGWAVVLLERPLEESSECNHLFNLCGKVHLELVPRLFPAA